MNGEHKKPDLMNHAGYRENFLKLHDLLKQLAEKDTAIQQLESRASQIAKTRLQERAEALLVGGSLDAPADLESDLERLQTERAILARAVEMQKEEVERQQMAASRQISLALAPDYAALVKRMIDKMIELAKLMKEERDFRENLIDARVSLTLGIRPMNYNARLDDAMDCHSVFRTYILQATEHGFIKKNYVPREFWEAWEHRES